jgi:hypothetical protein
MRAAEGQLCPSCLTGLLHQDDDDMGHLTCPDCGAQSQVRAIIRGQLSLGLANRQFSPPQPVNGPPRILARAGSRVRADGGVCRNGHAPPSCQAEQARAGPGQHHCGRGPPDHSVPALRAAHAAAPDRRAGTLVRVPQLRGHSQAGLACIGAAQRPARGRCARKVLAASEQILRAIRQPCKPASVVARSR